MSSPVSSGPAARTSTVVFGAVSERLNEVAKLPFGATRVVLVFTNDSVALAAIVTVTSLPGATLVVPVTTWPASAASETSPRLSSAPTTVTFAAIDWLLAARGLPSRTVSSVSNSSPGRGGPRSNTAALVSTLTYSTSLSGSGITRIESLARLRSRTSRFGRRFVSGFVWRIVRLNIPRSTSSVTFAAASAPYTPEIFDWSTSTSPDATVSVVVIRPSSRATATSLAFVTLPKLAAGAVHVTSSSVERSASLSVAVSVSRPSPATERLYELASSGVSSCSVVRFVPTIASAPASVSYVRVSFATVPAR
jgi:hypothetical protein